MRPIVVIPTYNESANLQILTQAIWQHAPELDIMIVDDNSPDGTGDIADGLALRHPGRLRVVHRPGKGGLGPAYVEGFQRALDAGYDTILQMDADLSHDPSFLPSLLEASKTADLVLGSRYVRGISVVNWDLKRLVLSKCASIYVRLITGLPVSDATGGFKCWRRSALQGVDLSSSIANGYLFQVEMTFRAWRKGCRISEVPIIFYERNLGKSKMHWHIIAEALIGVLRIKLAPRRWAMRQPVAASASARQ